MFSENYSVCLNDDGSPREIGRNGPVVTYKAIGYDSGRTVAMQFIPLASLSEGERVRFEESALAARKLNHENTARVFEVGAEDDHLVFVSEYVKGESAEEWIDEHGPMPADAVLRIGFQIANALGAAKDRGVLPGAIQPANLIILPGVAADGGWPRIKVRNFGLPAVKLTSGDGETRELMPSMPPQFASPEQRENTAIDARSDIFSLGATMWFLLTGSAPPAAEPNESSPRLSAPDVSRFVRNLISHMLRTNPEERPQDLSILAERIRACLQKAERQTAFTRSFAPTALPGTQKVVQKKRGAPVLALAATIVILAVLGAFLLPPRFANRERKPFGVMIGVPETTSEPLPASESESALAAPVKAAASAASPINQATKRSVAIAQQSPASPAVPVTAAVSAAKTVSQNADHSPSIPPVVEEVGNPSSSPQLAVNNPVAEPAPPAEGPAETSQPLVVAEAVPPAKKNEPTSSDVPDRAATADSSSAVAEKVKPTSSSENVRKRDDLGPSKRKVRRQRVARSSVPRPLTPLRVGSESARVVGTTIDGNWVLRLPSGQRLIAPPVPNLEDAPIVTPRHIRRVERPIPVEDEPPILVLPPDY
jgi:serine/threonine protein kinase